jgi:hypothetical protein
MRAMVCLFKLMANAKFVALETRHSQATVRAPLKITVSRQWVRILPHLRVRH